MSEGWCPYPCVHDLVEQTDFSLARPGKVSTEITLYGAKVTLCKVQPVHERKSLPSLPPSSLPLVSSLLLSWGVHSWLIPEGCLNGHLAFGWEHVSSFGLRCIAQLRGLAQTPLAHSKKLVQKACLASYEVQSSSVQTLHLFRPIGSPSLQASVFFLSQLCQRRPSSRRCSLSTTECWGTCSGPGHILHI